uniref:Uncharacterized protein n=1 Tax=Kalanchoe fedtschenkoi TaxID=63787 RepID=A0A7N0TLX5_KALFE
MPTEKTACHRKCRTSLHRQGKNREIPFEYFIVEADVNSGSSLLSWRFELENHNPSQVKRSRTELPSSLRERFTTLLFIVKFKSKDFLLSAGDIQQSDAEIKTIYTLGGRLKEVSNWLVNIMLSGNIEAIFPASTREYAHYVEELWRDPAFKATYKRRNEIEKLPRAASYFLDRAAEISMVDYEPSDRDILFAEGMTSSNGISSMEFPFPISPTDGYLEPPFKNDSSTSYQLIRLHTRALGENCKWIDMFEDIDLVIFCVSLTDYCQLNDDGTNKMLASRKLFERMITHKTLADKQFLLILNKFDLLEEVIECTPLTQCDWFADFNPVISKNSTARTAVYTNPSLAHRAFNYIAVKFKRLYESTVESDRKLYVSAVTGLEPKSVDEALRYARHILNWQNR